MKIVGVCACVAGIAHTYLAKEKLINAASKRGHEIKVETQGVIGIENELTEEEIKESTSCCENKSFLPIIFDKKYPIVNPNGAIILAWIKLQIGPPNPSDKAAAENVNTTLFIGPP